MVTVINQANSHNLSRMYNGMLTGVINGIHWNLDKTSIRSFNGTLMRSLTGTLIRSLNGNLLEKAALVDGLYNLCPPRLCTSLKLDD